MPPKRSAALKMNKETLIRLWEMDVSGETRARKLKQLAFGEDSEEEKAEKSEKGRKASEEEKVVKSKKGRKVSEEEKVAKSMKGRKVSEEEKVVNSKKGRNASEEEKVVKSKKGRKGSEEEKVAKSMKGRKASEEEKVVKSGKERKDQEGENVLHSDCDSDWETALEHENSRVTTDVPEVTTEADENGYFSMFSEDEDSSESDDSSSSDESGTAHKKPANGDEEEENSQNKTQKDPEASLLAFQELKRIAANLLPSLLLNLKGMDRWVDDNDQEEALKLFQQAAEVDRANVNALKHWRYVLRKMGRHEEAEAISGKIQQTMQEFGDDVVQARSEAELGIAFKSRNWMGALGKVTGYLANALKLAGKKVPAAELEFWRLTQAEAFYWWYLCRWTVGIPGELEMLDKAIDLFAQVAASKHADALTQAQAWNRLGEMLFTRDANLPDILRSKIRKYKLRGPMRSEEVFQKAQSLDPDSALVCVQYATFLMRFRNLDKAKHMINRAFSLLDPDTVYYHVYAMRAELSIKLYHRDHKKEHLDQAIKDLTFFTEHVSQSYGYAMLGGANYLLTIHDKSKPIEEKDMSPALVAYESANLGLGYRRNAITHFHHAECLQGYGFRRGAVESSKRSVEHQHPGDRSVKFTLSFMMQLLQLYEDEQRADHIMSECVYWIDLICRKYEQGHVRELLRKLHERHGGTMTRLYQNLRFNKNDDSARLFLKFIPDFKHKCSHPAIRYVPPPKLESPSNIIQKPFDFLLLHSSADEPWVFCSFLPKMEMIYQLKGCVIGRDIEAEVSSNTTPAKVVSAMISDEPEVDDVAAATRRTEDGPGHPRVETETQELSHKASATATNPHKSGNKNPVTKSETKDFSGKAETKFEHRAGQRKAQQTKQGVPKMEGATMESETPAEGMHQEQPEYGEAQAPTEKATLDEYSPEPGNEQTGKKVTNESELQNQTEEAPTDESMQGTEHKTMEEKDDKDSNRQQETTHASTTRTGREQLKEGEANAPSPPNAVINTSIEWFRDLGKRMILIYMTIPIPKTPALSSCLIVVLTEALVGSPWFEDGKDGEGRRPSSSLLKLLDAHNYLIVLQWDDNLKSASLLPTKHRVQVFDCSDLVHWDRIAAYTMNCGGRRSARPLPSGLLVNRPATFLHPAPPYRQKEAKAKDELNQETDDSATPKEPKTENN